jgi:hypothetical protein
MSVSYENRLAAWLGKGMTRLKNQDLPEETITLNVVL